MYERNCFSVIIIQFNRDTEDQYFYQRSKRIIIKYV